MILPYIYPTGKKSISIQQYLRSCQIEEILTAKYPIKNRHCCIAQNTSYLMIQPVTVMVHQFKVWNINSILLHEEAQQICIHHVDIFQHMETESTKLFGSLRIENEYFFSAIIYKHILFKCIVEIKYIVRYIFNY